MGILVLVTSGGPKGFPKFAGIFFLPSCSDYGNEVKFSLPYGTQMEKKMQRVITLPCSIQNEKVLPIVLL